MSAFKPHDRGNKLSGGICGSFSANEVFIDSPGRNVELEALTDVMAGGPEDGLVGAAVTVYQASFLQLHFHHDSGIGAGIQGLNSLLEN